MAFWGHLLGGPCLPNFNCRSLPPMCLGVRLWVAQWCGMKTEEQGPKLLSGFAWPPAQPSEWIFLEVIPGRG